MLDYTIVVPTLDRPQNMATIFSLFPSAIVTVNKSNAGMFKAVVPKGRLLTHPDMRLIETRNWILENIETDCVIQFNDDTQFLVGLVGRVRRFRDAELIRAVVENTLQIAIDLDVGVFTWSLCPNTVLLRPELRPFRAAAPCSAHAFGVRGKARSRRFSTDFRGCGDFDFTLQTLLEDRQILCDVRWYFNCGGMSRGKGGQTGELARQEFEAGQANLRRKWGKYVGESNVQRIEKRKTWRSFSVAVPRTSPLAAS